jgi:hypothetical protein
VHKDLGMRGQTALHLQQEFTANIVVPIMQDTVEIVCLGS